MSSADASQLQTRPFVFTGKAGEYFSIWIVNVALTILTLGIYSAWAKVRTNQYFYGNTCLDDVSFRYLADPKQILKGRIVAFVLFAAYYFSGMISPQASAIMFLVLMLLFPAFLVMSMAFRARNSAWRNVRFDFVKDFRKAYSIFIVPALLLGAIMVASIAFMPEQSAGMSEEEMKNLEPPWGVMAGMLVFFLLFPWFEYLVARFRVVHAKYGGEGFAFGARTWSYYGMYIMAIFIMLLLGVLVFIVMAGVSAMLAVIGLSAAEDGVPSPLAPLIPFVMFLFFMPFYLWIFAYFQARRTNLIFNNMSISGHRLQSDLKVGALLALYLTNTFAILFSLGLLIPWAKIRTARYRASRTHLLAQGDLGEFSSIQRERQSAMGEEIGEMLDMDLGF